MFRKPVLFSSSPYGKTMGQFLGGNRVSGILRVDAINKVLFHVYKHSAQVNITANAVL